MLTSSLGPAFEAGLFYCPQNRIFPATAMSLSSAPASPQLQLSSVAFFGRTFAEYIDLFGLNPKTLATQRVLDVAAGPSSFTAEAAAAGIKAIAVDPLYGQPVESLRTHVQLDYA